MMDFFKKHIDTAIVLGAIFSSFVWMDGKFSAIDAKFTQVDKNISELDKQITIVKTVLLMKNILPQELVNAHVEEQTKHPAQ